MLKKCVCFVKTKTSVQRFLWIIVILVIWQIVAVLGLIPKSVIPPVTVVFNEFVRQVYKGNILLQAWTSIIIIIEGVVISFVISWILAYLCIVSTTVKSFIDTISIIMNPIPGVALLPLIMLSFGLGETSMIVILVHAILWPMIIELIAAYNSVNVIHREYTKNLGISSFKFAKDVLFFSSMPYLISGIKIGWARAWRALISSEMIFGAIGTTGGLGTFIYLQRAYANAAGIFVGIVTITIIGICIEQICFSALEKVSIKKWGMYH